VARAESYLRAKFHLDPSNRLAAIRQRYRQTDRTAVRTVLQTVAHKREVMDAVLPALSVRRLVISVATARERREQEGMRPLIQGGARGRPTFCRITSQ